MVEPEGTFRWDPLPNARQQMFEMSQVLGDDLRNGCPLSHSVWHSRDLSVFNDLNCRVKVKIVALFRRWLYSHASIAVAFSDLIILNMLIAGTQGH